jgi:hypothetical protein
MYLGLLGLLAFFLDSRSLCPISPRFSQGVGLLALIGSVF